MLRFPFAYEHGGAVLSHGSVFTGCGLLDYGLCLAGLDEPRWVAEWDEWRREAILAKRYPRAVRYDDVRRVGRDSEPVELIAGGFPCKGASTVGKRNGFDHAETVLWREFKRAIGELRPRYVLVENVANILALHGGAVWGEVLGDLAALGYDTVWDCIPAAAVGAPHLRDRVFAVATYTDGQPVRQQPEPQRGRSGAALAGRAGQAAPDSTIVAQREPADEGDALASRREARAVTGGRDGAAPADAGSGRREGQQAEHGQEPALALPDDERPGLRVEWGRYGAAIERWEQSLGRVAPEPLVRRVDDRGASRVERSRVSALGDGVQVQVGAIAGAYILALEQQRQELIAA